MSAGADFLGKGWGFPISLDHDAGKYTIGIAEGDACIRDSIHIILGTAKGESRYSWTVDLADRRKKAREKMQPILDEAATIKSDVVDLKERLKLFKKDKASKKESDTLQDTIKEKEKIIEEISKFKPNEK